MDAGADVCVQSTHKLAGGLQQTGLIHWREGRVDSELMEEAYREYVTTSPSYHLLASRRRRRAHARRAGRARRSAARSRARASSRRRCASALPDLDHLDDPAWLDAVADARRRACDLVKTTVGLARYDTLGLRRRAGAGRARRS